MPPRRPGGKYKGFVSRSKGEETLLAEAADARKRQLAEHIARLEMKKDSDLKSALELNRQKAIQQEAMRQRIINMWMGGRKGNSQKMFKAWQIGVQIYKQDRLNKERDLRWRKSCGCNDKTCPGGCSTYKRLCDPIFKLPWEAAQRSGAPVYGGVSELLGLQASSSSSSLLPPLSKSQTDLNFAERGGTASTSASSAVVSPSSMLRADGSLQRSWSLSGMTVGGSFDETTFVGGGGRTGGGDGGSECRRGLLKASAWPCKCQKCRGHQPLPSFLDEGTAKVMIHHKTGRRCLVDPRTMRMCIADVICPHVFTNMQAVM
mmetsp:Transcript_86279/g.225008  ORF Transcript_86279/g.225008 Transcript_86279/m.225008 type:complete len:318 (-) Transcript_86279:81-1034(-)